MAELKTYPPANPLRPAAPGAAPAREAPFVLPQPLEQPSVFGRLSLPVVSLEQAPSFVLEAEAKRLISISKSVMNELDELGDRMKVQTEKQAHAKSPEAWWSAKAEQLRIDERRDMLKRFQEDNGTLAPNAEFALKMIETGDCERARSTLKHAMQTMTFVMPHHERPVPDEQLAKIRAITSSEPCSKLTSEVTSEIVRVLALGMNVRGEWMLRMAANPNFSRMSPEQQTKFLRFASQIPEHALGDLRTIVGSADAGTRTPILLHRDFAGKSLLEHFMDAGASMPHSEIRTSTNTYLAEVIKEIANYASVPQGLERGTCVCSSIRHFIGFYYPAEYTRIALGLGSEAGQVRLASGARLRTTLSARKPDNSGRTAPARLVDASLMDFGNGTKREYLNDSDTHYDTIQGKHYPTGLNGEEAKAVLEGLFGSKFAFTKKQPKDGEAFVKELLEIERAVEARPQRSIRLVALHNPALDGKLHDHHAYNIREIKDGRVYLANPWGPTNERKGSILKATDMRVEDPRQGIYSMPIEDFSKRFCWMLFPK